MSKLLGTLEKAAIKLAPGRAPLFIEAHLVKALMTIDYEGTVGRIKLSKTLGLGEGTIRTMIRHLENEKLIDISKLGISLTNSGRKLTTTLKSRLSKEIEVPRSSLTIGPFNVAILVKKAADAVRGGVEQRDAAIKIGALGATTLIYRHGSLCMPVVDEDVFQHAPTVREALISKLKPQENDVIIIGSANDKLTAALGAIAAVLETLRSH